MDVCPDDRSKSVSAECQRTQRGRLTSYSAPTTASARKPNSRNVIIDTQCALSGRPRNHRPCYMARRDSMRFLKEEDARQHHVSTAASNCATTKRSCTTSLASVFSALADRRQSSRRRSHSPAPSTPSIRSTSPGLLRRSPRIPLGAETARSSSEPRANQLRECPILAGRQGPRIARTAAVQPVPDCHQSAERDQCEQGEREKTPPLPENC